MANWTPESSIGKLFKTIGKCAPPAPGVKSPALRGSKAHLDALFGSNATVAALSGARRAAGYFIAGDNGAMAHYMPY